MKIDITYTLRTPDKEDFEVVERKGLGHPDTLADGIAEIVEIEYAKYCLNMFGYIPHHNFDKIIIQGGLFRQKMGYKNTLCPIKIIFFGRASKNVNGINIPLKTIQINAAKKYLSRILPNLDINDEKQIIFISETTNYTKRDNWFTPRSIEDLPEYSKGGPYANDTATMISYWPLTLAEKLALEIEGYFYNENNDGLPYPRIKEFGQDIKVMVIRIQCEYNITVAIPVLNFLIKSINEYITIIENISSELHNFIQKKHPQIKFYLSINSNQNTTKNSNPYLVTTGSCIDFGEEGAVGRGNKTHGIISSFRPNTMEAPHGKNSTYFVGKVLGYIVDKVAKDIYDLTKSPCQVIMRANIGDYLYKPTCIMICLENKVDTKIIEQIVKNHLSIESKTTIDIITSNHFIPNTICYAKDNS